MKTLKVSFIYLITVFTFVLISGCSKEENPAGGNGDGGTPAINALIGTWNATSSTNPNIQGGSNLISAENTMKFTFTATNFTFNGTGQFCDPGESCSQTGAVTATATSFTVTWSDMGIPKLITIRSREIRSPQAILTKVGHIPSYVRSNRRFGPARIGIHAEEETHPAEDNKISGHGT